VCLLWEKSPLAISPFSFFIFLFQKAEDPVTSWTLDLCKAYPRPTMLNPVLVSVCLEKRGMPFSLLAGFKAACVNLQTQ
jgi:hypothetical protein